MISVFYKKSFGTILFYSVLSVLLTVFLVASAHSAKVEYKKVKVMSYNIKVGVGGDKKQLTAEQGLEKVAKIIERYDPDILLVQEIEKGAKRTQYVDELTWLMHRLDYTNSAFAPAIIDSTWNYGVAVFDRYPHKHASQKIKLYKPDYSESHPEYPGYYSEQRVLLRAQVNIKGATVNVFCTHLGLTPDQRERQVKEIMDRLDEWDCPFILGGDFNAKPGSKEIMLLNEKYQNAFEVLNIPLAKRFSFPAGKSPEDAIDKFFVSPDIKVLKAKVIRDGTLASDHNPIIWK